VGLKKSGVAAVFQPGTAMDEIVKFIRENVDKTRSQVVGVRS
jgi:methylmalonyl-CoA mutase cobalamin-binding subunit